MINEIEEPQGDELSWGMMDKRAIIAALNQEICDTKEDIDFLAGILEAFVQWGKITRGTARFRLGELVVCQLVKLKLRPRNAGYLQRIESLGSQYEQWLAVNTPIDRAFR